MKWFKILFGSAITGTILAILFFAYQLFVPLKSNLVNQGKVLKAEAAEAKARAGTPAFPSLQPQGAQLPAPVQGDQVRTPGKHKAEVEAATAKPAAAKPMAVVKKSEPKPEPESVTCPNGQVIPVHSNYGGKVVGCQGVYMAPPPRDKPVAVSNLNEYAKPYVGDIRVAWSTRPAKKVRAKETKAHLNPQLAPGTYRLPGDTKSSVTVLPHEGS